MASLDARFNSLGMEQAQSFLAIKGKSSSSRNGVLRFENPTCIGKFRTGKDGVYSTLDVEIPQLIPKSVMENVVGTYLGTDIERADVIIDYKGYFGQKREFFLKWIHDNNYFAEVAQGKYRKPEFVSFGSSNLFYPMMTPFVTLHGDWEIYAAKIRDVIYPWYEREENCTKSWMFYYGVYFKHILTHQEPRNSCQNHYEKGFVVNELKFGSHQPLCFSEISAEDDNGSWADIHVFKKCSPNGMAAKHLKFWAQSVVTGAPTLVLGERDDKGRLLHIETTTADDLARKFARFWTPQVCYNFQDRLLTWIKSHFNESNPKKVKKFSWKGVSDPFAYAFDMEERYLPQELLRINAFELNF